MAGVDMINAGGSLVRSCWCATQVSKRLGVDVGVSFGAFGSRTYASDTRYDESFFKLTRWRYVQNEMQQISSHTIHYDLKELTRIAAEAVGSKACIDIEKLPDGMFNKTLLLSMDDGRQVVAKLPYPCAGLPHYTTASEVATMGFARDVLDTPAPKVFAWSSRASQTAVGAEYIIMERVPGVSLHTVWGRVKFEDRSKIVKAISAYQKTWMSASFNGYGSLYFAKDLETALDRPLYRNESGAHVAAPKYAVGPSTGREWLDDGRAAVELKRGPWATCKAYATAIGQRELACVTSLARLPKSPVTLFGPNSYVPTRKKKLRALDCYLDIVKYIIPTDPSISQSHLWHPDLHIENIFVDANDHTKITGIIDWQSTELAPLYDHARQPHFLDYEGPPVHGLERPELPDDFSELEPATRRYENQLFLNRSLVSFYRTLAHLRNPRLYSAMEFRETPSFNLLLFARNLLIDGEATYLALLVESESTWADLPGVKAHGNPPFPFTFSDDENRAIQADAEGALKGMDIMGGVKNALGELFPELGVVKPEQYDECKDALRQMKEQVLEQFAESEEEREKWRELWPFDD